MGFDSLKKDATLSEASSHVGDVSLSGPSHVEPNVKHVSIYYQWD